MLHKRNAYNWWVLLINMTVLHARAWNIKAIEWIVLSIQSGKTLVERLASIFQSNFQCFHCMTSDKQKYSKLAQKSNQATLFYLCLYSESDLPIPFTLQPAISRCGIEKIRSDTIKLSPMKMRDLCSCCILMELSILGIFQSMLGICVHSANIEERKSDLIGSSSLYGNVRPLSVMHSNELEQRAYPTTLLYMGEVSLNVTFNTYKTIKLQRIHSQ